VGFLPDPSGRNLQHQKPSFDQLLFQLRRLPLAGSAKVARDMALAAEVDAASLLGVKQDPEDSYAAAFPETLAGKRTLTAANRPSLPSRP
jgi:hypothetical protein